MRLDAAFVRDTAKAMINGDAARIWTYVGDEIREALIDRAVMDCVRLADETSPVTTGQLVEFRGRLVELLEEGVFIGKSKHGLMLDSVREERRARREGSK